MQNDEQSLVAVGCCVCFLLSRCSPSDRIIGRNGVPQIKVKNTDRKWAFCATLQNQKTYLKNFTEGRSKSREFLNAWMASNL